MRACWSHRCSFLAGIPGTMGGALAMNAGAFGGETWPIVEGVTTIDRAGVVRERPPADFVVAYRHVERAGGRAVHRLYAVPRAWRCGTGTGSDPRCWKGVRPHTYRAAELWFDVPQSRPATMPHA